MLGFKTVLVVFLVLSIQGCIQADYRKGTQDSNSEKGILVLGVNVVNEPFYSGLLSLVGKPSVTMERHTYKNGQLTGSTLLPFSTNIIDGYAVIELPITGEDQRYALGFYKRAPMSDYSYGFGCKNTKQNVFSVGKGEVLYIGHYKMHSFQSDARKITWAIESKNKLDLAESFIKNKHPELLSRLKLTKIQREKVQVG